MKNIVLVYLNCGNGVKERVAVISEYHNIATNLTVAMRSFFVFNYSFAIGRSADKSSSPIAILRITENNTTPLQLMFLVFCLTTGHVSQSSVTILASFVGMPLYLAA